MNLNLYSSMSDNPAFLKYLLNDSLYLIDDESDAVSDFVVEKDDASVLAIEQSTNLVLDSKPTYVEQLKEVLVLFENPSDMEMKSAERAFLEKILGAVKLQWKDVQPYNVSKQQLMDFKHSKIIAFTSAHGLPVQTMYQLTTNHVQKIIVGHDLTTIAASVDHKKQLWAALQQMFA
ncbi:hypothetical protein N6H18_16140 [Reichenbachiella agarivorans]|uniref:Uncharacterized protein n=1 Tax=Reichenbachiella agarivorans TaxID=2979464 RepID=A0ABY6CMY4_9BACT|nr:hypothetical protein [Reichenbachiella agarivorans]UXP31878.1 hypothetical protein N6H18_16140 [Reichenbachiella agarivorans]